MRRFSGLNKAAKWSAVVPIIAVDVSFLHSSCTPCAQQVWFGRYDVFGKAYFLTLEHICTTGYLVLVLLKRHFVGQAWFTPLAMKENESQKQNPARLLHVGMYKSRVLSAHPLYSERYNNSRAWGATVDTTPPTVGWSSLVYMWRPCADSNVFTRSVAAPLDLVLQ